MPSEYTERTLEEVAFISSGKRPPTVSKERSPDALVPVVGGGGPSGYTTQPLTTEQVLITGRVGTLGKLHGFRAPVWPSDNALVIRPRLEVVSFEYLRYALGNVIHFAIGMNRGAANPLVTQSDLGKLPIPVPDAGTQAEIAAVLTSLDDRIDLLSQTNATLESIAQALFKSWFINFDPVRAKVEGREPEGIDAATAALFPAEFDESDMGLLPRGWRVASIQDVVDNVYDGPHATPPESLKGPVFLGIKNLSGTSIDLADVRHISEDDWARWTKRVTPQANDIVFSYEAALGLFALIPPSLRCCLGRRLALVRPKREDGTPHFWFHQFIGAPFQRLLDKHTVHGATVNRIALKEFPSFKVMDPGEQIRNAFEAIAMPIWARIHANRQHALNLAQLRDSLLPRLVSGKVQLQRSALGVS